MISKVISFNYGGKQSVSNLLRHDKAKHNGAKVTVTQLRVFHIRSSTESEDKEINNNIKIKIKTFPLSPPTIFDKMLSQPDEGLQKFSTRKMAWPFDKFNASPVLDGSLACDAGITRFQSYFRYVTVFLRQMIPNLFIPFS